MREVGEGQARMSRSTHSSVSGAAPVMPARTEDRSCFSVSAFLTRRTTIGGLRSRRVSGLSLALKSRSYSHHVENGDLVPFNGIEEGRERELTEDDHGRGKEEALVEHDHETIYVVARIR